MFYTGSFKSCLLLSFSLISYCVFAAVDIKEAVTIGGIKQWITIKGTSPADPVILFLHGGPGNSSMGYGDQFTGELRKKFLVVQWDQRETGKTKNLNKSSVKLTTALLENDAFELIQYLRARFSKEKIYLMGHSWGGYLCLSMAAKHPDLLAACFAISPMVNQLESERETLAIMKANAIREGNTIETAELGTVKIPFENGEQLYFDRKWLTHLMGQKSFPKAFVASWATPWLPVFNEASAVNFFETAREIRCPIYFLVGGKDYQTYFKLTEEYFKTVKAEKKEIFWFPDQAHSFLVSQRQRLQEIILQLTFD